MAVEQALRDWADWALTFINANDGAVRSETDTWVRDGDRFVRRTWRRLVYRPDVAYRTLRGKEFARVVWEIQRDPLLSLTFGRYVGPQGGMGTVFNDVSLFNAFLPSDIDPGNPKERLKFDAEQFDNSLRELSRFRSELNVSFIQLYPIIGLEAEVPIDLEPGLRIEPMEDAEIIEALTWGVLPTHMNKYREFRLTPGTTLALKRRYAVPRAVLPAFPGPQVAENSEHSFERDLDVPHALSITAKGRVELGPRFMYCTAGWPYGVHTITQPKVYSDDRDGGRNMSLPGGIEPQLQRTWKALVDSAGFYKIAARRFYQSHLRDFVEDRLIDDAICGEALLTAQSRANKSSRFRLNAAFYLGEGDQAEQRRVFALFWNAYKIRSSIVHGTAPDEADVQIGGAPAKLYEFEEAFESELRRLLKKMADTGDCAAPIEWTQIVAGQAP